MGKFLSPAWWYSGKGNDIDKEDLETFKEETLNRGIPEENILDCTKAGNGTVLFPVCIFHFTCKCAVEKQMKLFLTDSS